MECKWWGGKKANKTLQKMTDLCTKFVYSCLILIMIQYEQVEQQE